MPRFGPPGYKYLGPGNKLNSGKPVSKADSVARDHDLSYSVAKSADDIRAADWKAIGDFANSIGEDPFGGVIGAVGLGAKYGVESLTGVLYPQMPPTGKKKKVSYPPYSYKPVYAKWKVINRRKAEKKRLLDQQNRDGEEAGPSNKLRVVDPFEAPLPGSADDWNETEAAVQSIMENQEEEPPLQEGEEPMESDAVTDSNVNSAQTTSNTTASAGSPYSQGGGSCVTPWFKTPSSNSMYKTIRHSHVFRLWGNSWLWDNGGNGPTSRGLCTSMALFPAEYIAFYMTPDEYNFFRSCGHSIVVKAAYRVTPLGITASFNTGSTVSQDASTHFYARAGRGRSLNKIFGITGFKPVYATGGGLSVTSANGVTATDWIDRMWGTNSDWDEQTSLSTIMGIQRDWPMYARVHFQNRSEYAGTKLGVPKLLDYMEYTSADSIINKPMIDWSYHPQNGTFCQPPIFGYCQPQSTADSERQVYYGTGNKSVFRSEVFPNFSSTDQGALDVLTGRIITNYQGSVEAAGSFDPLGDSSVANNYQTDGIDVGASTWSLNHKPRGFTCIPQDIAGLYPTYVNSPTTTAGSPVNVSCIVKLDTYITVKVLHHSVDTRRTIRPQTHTLTVDNRFLAPVDYYDIGTCYGLTPVQAFARDNSKLHKVRRPVTRSMTKDRKVIHGK